MTDGHQEAPCSSTVLVVLTVVALLGFFHPDRKAIAIIQFDSPTRGLCLTIPSPPSIPINPFFIMSEEVAKAFVAHFYQQFTQGAAGLASLYVS
jgi:hypothetical protein